MLFTLLLSAQAKFIENHLSLDQPQFVGRFSGNEVTAVVSCRIDVDRNIEDPIYLQLWVFSEKVVFQCGLEHSSKIDIVSLPATDEWGEDLKFTYASAQQYFFYLSDCDKKMKPNEQLVLQLELQDTDYEHYPLEYANTNYALGFFLFVHVVVIFLAIYGIYQDTHEEIPLVFIFIISLVYIVSIVFNFLAYWIYGMDGTSFRFIFMFCKFFEVFGRVSLLSMLLLIISDGFDPKEFYISGSNFAVFFAAVLLEFGVEVAAILRFEVLESFQATANFEALCTLLIRFGLCALAAKYKGQNLGKRVDGFRKVPTCIKLLVFSPVITLIVFTLSPMTGKFVALYVTENVITVLASFYLLARFMSASFSGVLPTKQHST